MSVEHTEHISIFNPKKTAIEESARKVSEAEIVTQHIHQGENMQAHHQHEEYSNEEVQQYADQARAYWENADPNQLIETEAFQNKLFTAGGGLVLLYGDEESEVWQAMKKVAEANNGKITVAGIAFNIDDLANMGDFYRWTGKEMACIDERLDMNRETGCQIHQSCGACGGVEAAIKDVITFKVDEQAAKELAKKDGKSTLDRQPIVGNAHLQQHHESVGIYVHTSSDGRTAKADRTDVIKNHALAFNVSVPLDLIGRYAEEKGLSVQQVDELIDTMVAWNAKIAHVIIGGHNLLSDATGKTFIVFDKRDTQASADAIQQKLNSITTQHVVWSEVPMTA